MSNPHPITSKQPKHEIVGVYEHVGVKSFTYYANLLVDQLTIPAGAQVLDVATGRGAFLFAAANKVSKTVARDSVYYFGRDNQIVIQVLKESSHEKSDCA